MTENPAYPDKPPAPELQPARKQIDSTFRNGSVTAIGVVLAFSLGFLNNWSSLPTAWIPEDLIAVALIAGGIAFQIWAMAGMLSVASLEVPVYQRIIRIFLIGLTLVALGVLMAIGGDSLNYARSLLRG
jgi:hypothetical protein